MRTGQTCSNYRFAPRRLVMAATAVMAFAALIGGQGAFATSPTIAAAAHDIGSMTTAIDDMEVSFKVGQLDSKELAKIGRDFAFSTGMQYRLKNLTLQYKKPDKIRLTGQLPAFGEALLILNGPTRYYKVPRLQKRVENLEKSPASRLSMLEYSGILSPDTLSFMKGTFVRTDKQDGKDMLVYDMNYQGPTSGIHYRLWFDPVTHINTKREWIDGDNKLKATFLYSEPKEVKPGVWLPTRIEVKNADGMTAAVTSLEDVKIDQGLSDDLFTIEQ